MTTLREAAQQALEALEYHVEQTRPIWKTSEAITALRAALAQQTESVTIEQAQEPLGWAVQIGTHSAGRRQGKPRYVLFFNKADAEDLADRTRGARPEPFYLEGQR